MAVDDETRRTTSPFDPAELARLAAIVDRGHAKGASEYFAIYCTAHRDAIVAAVARDVVDQRASWCWSEDCRYRNWRSGPMPTHKIGPGCPPALSSRAILDGTEQQ